MPRLLVSVRSAEEALAALDGGADIIDVKEPSLGSLGMTDSATIQEVVKLVAGKVPVSIALGEVDQSLQVPELDGVTWVKQGFRECWRQKRALKTLASWLILGRKIQPVRLIGVVYADHHRAYSPPFDVVLDWYRKLQLEGANPPGILIDTALKDGKGLLCWKSPAVLRQHQKRCRRAGLFLAVAGSLRLDDIRLLLEYAQPDVIAVRGAVCEGNERNGKISQTLVRQLKHVVGC